jgi:guanosine-3',5'-bis(diphosphate) 3'-pyrophosphohydrolase
MIRINDILDKVASYHPEADLDIIDRAYIYSARMHDGQVRLSGEPYLAHPLEVANILADMKLDVTSVAAGFLHDALEDTKATVEDLKNMFGEEVTRIVSGVTKLSRLSFKSSEERQAESIRKMILAMADDIRVLLIKLADRLHNMRTLQFHKPEKQVEIAQETLDIYAPLANRLGIFWIKKELEDTAFKYIQPDEYNRIRGWITKNQEERAKYIENVKTILKGRMEEYNLECEVLGRHKHFYSIYHKMVDQGLNFEDLYDIIAFRIILSTVKDCYEALGIIHSLWKPIPKRFKDYIAMPKSNMYQSLHTAVIGPFGERLEVQIRTHEMNKIAEEGIAAHWQYKEGRVGDEQSDRQFAWLRQLIKSQKHLRDPREFMDTVRIDLFPDEVYVFTPKGDVKEFPKGATPVDFAYSIHSEVGHRCTGAKVDGRMVPLKYKLQTGERIDVITSPRHKPSKDWLNFVVTSRARSRIRQWIKTEEREKSLALGKELCEKEFQKHNIPFNPKSEKFLKIAEEFGFKANDDLLAAIGYGKITPLQAVNKLLPKPATEEDTVTFIDKLKRRIQKKKRHTGILVHGVEDIMIRFGKCCNPIPGDSVVGYITRGRGVTVHRVGCVSTLKIDPERKIDLEWAEGAQETHPAKIRVACHNKIGLLADISAIISKEGANIIDVSIRANTPYKQAECTFVLEVANTKQLDMIIRKLKKIKFVLSVARQS